MDALPQTASESPVAAPQERIPQGEVASQEGRTSDSLPTAQAERRRGPRGDSDPNVGIRALHDFVVIEPVADNQTLGGGIVVPQMDAGQTNRLSRGIVRAVGPGKASDYDGTLLPVSVSVGDVIYLLLDHSAQEIFHRGKAYIITRDRYISIVMDDAAAKSQSN